jgi:predicted metalloprotease with PDZ domain
VTIAAAVNNDLSDEDMVNLLYDGGFLVAEALDERLSEMTGGRIHLIDVLRDLYNDETIGDGVDMTALCSAISRVGGGDLSSFIEGLVNRPSPQALMDRVSPRSGRISRSGPVAPKPPPVQVSS